jgi:hypothetical protein
LESESFVKLAGQTAAILLTEDGRQILELAGVNLSQSAMLSASVEESEDLGLWIRLQREDQMHLFLLRWEYILGVDVPSGLGKVIGLKG